MNEAPFEIVGEISDIEITAVGNQIRNINRSASNSVADAGAS